MVWKLLFYSVVYQVLHLCFESLYLYLFSVSVVFQQNRLCLMFNLNKEKQAFILYLQPPVF